MKIGIDIKTLDQQNLRGIGKCLFSLLFYLSKIDKKNAYFLFSDKRSEFIRQLDLPSNFQRVFTGIKGEKFHLWEQIALPLEASKRALDFFHYPANTLPLFSTVPGIVTLHDVMMLEYKKSGNIENFYTNFVFKNAIKKADIVITISEYSKKKIIEYLDIAQERICVIYHGIDPMFKKCDDVSLVNKTLGKCQILGDYILCVGGNTERKNIPKMIEAYVILRKDPSITQKLALTGISKNIDKIMENVSAELKNDIKLLPYLSEEELIILYSGASVMVYPSCNEGFGLPILEAMACGAPVVTSNCASLPEIGGDAAYYIDPFSAEDMAKKIGEVLKNYAFKRSLIEKGLKRIQSFKWETTAEKTLDVYKKIFFDNKRERNC